MKKLVSFAMMMAAIVVLFSCTSNSKRYHEMGIGREVRINSQYWIIPFNQKVSSDDLNYFMEREDFRCAQTASLNNILAQLDSNGHRHAALYKVNEFSKPATVALTKIAVAMKEFKNPEEMCPIFHIQKDSIFADYGDFGKGWTDGGGYVIVTRK
jgi:hypothetical protein